MNLLIKARYGTTTVGALVRELARSATRFSKILMAGNDIGTSQTHGATKRSKNSDNALGEEETTNRAPKAPTPLTVESLEIVGSLNHFWKVGTCGLDHRNPFFSKALEASGPILGSLFGSPLLGSGGSPSSPSNGTTHVST